MRNGRAFQWVSYIDLAEELLKQVPKDRKDNQLSEARARCGISRVYYGVFHVVQDYLKETGFVPQTIGEGSHQAVIKACREFKNNKSLLRIGNDLERLKDKRTKADYHDVYFELAGSPYGRFHKELQLAIMIADGFLSEIDKLRQL